MKTKSWSRTLRGGVAVAVAVVAAMAAAPTATLMTVTAVGTPSPCREPRGVARGSKGSAWTSGAARSTSARPPAGRSAAATSTGTRPSHGWTATARTAATRRAGSPSTTTAWSISPAGPTASTIPASPTSGCTRRAGSCWRSWTPASTTPSSTTWPSAPTAPPTSPIPMRRRCFGWPSRDPAGRSAPSSTPSGTIETQAGFNLGGIVATRDGRALIVAQGNVGALWRFDLRSKAVTSDRARTGNEPGQRRRPGPQGQQAAGDPQLLPRHHHAETVRSLDQCRLDRRNRDRRRSALHHRKAGRQPALCRRQQIR